LKEALIIFFLLLKRRTLIKQIGYLERREKVVRVFDSRFKWPTLKSQRKTCDISVDSESEGCPLSAETCEYNEPWNEALLMRASLLHPSQGLKKTREKERRVRNSPMTS